MAYPVSVSKNNYFQNRKKSTVETPIGIAKCISNIILSNNVKVSQVWDIGCYRGNLSLPWSNIVECVGVDVEDFGYHGKMNVGDFLSIKVEEFHDASAHYAFKPDCLFLCNPPFNYEYKGGKIGRKFLPELFLKQIFDLAGYDRQVVLITPMGGILNQRKKSTRWRWLRDCGAQITSRLALPIDAFPNVQFHAEVLFFNIAGIKPHYFLGEEFL